MASDFWLKLRSEHFMLPIVRAGMGEMAAELWHCSVLWRSCFCPLSVTLEDGGHQLLRSYLFQVLQRLVLAPLVLLTWGKIKLVPTNVFLYRYTWILNAQPYQKFPKLILAGRRHLWELNLLPTQSSKYTEVHFCSTYLNQLPQLQILLNICMISKVGVLKITFL